MSEPEFSEQDKALLVFMEIYDRERRRLIGKEYDVHALWRVITAADALRKRLGMVP